MSNTQFIVSSRDGVRMRTASWAAAAGVPQRGICAIFNGHTEFIEKYGEVIDELAARGFAGATLDWRGQGGSERPLADPLKAYVTDFADYDADLRAFLDEIILPLTQDRRPPIVLAHSMGAHIVLRALHRDPQTFAAAILVAPMLQLETGDYPDTLVRLLSAGHSRFGLSQSWVWGMGGREPLHVEFDGNRVTSDRARFARTQNFLAANPGLRLAGPSWGWLDAAYRSMAAMARPGFAESITTPMLIFGAGRDRIVSTAAMRKFAQRLPRGSYIELADAEHEILMENDSIRARFWSAFDAFVEQTMGSE